MKISQKGIDLIKSFEGFRSESYQDVGGVWTIGYGHTGNVHRGEVITKKQGELLLRSDLETFEKAVNKNVKVKLTQSMYDALVSFTYNVGSGAFSKSTLLKKLNSGDYVGASEQFGAWNKCNGKVVKGLTNRREKEKTLFLSDGIPSSSKGASVSEIPSLKGYKGFSVVDGLKQFGYDSSFEARKKYAEMVGINNYKGNSKQNTTLLNILKGTSSSLPNLKGCTSVGLVDALKEKGYDSSFQARKKYAESVGIKNYKGTYQQNVTLLDKLKR